MKISHKISEWNNSNHKDKMWQWYWKSSKYLQDLSKIIYKNCKIIIQYSEVMSQSIINMHDHLKSDDCQ